VTKSTINVKNQTTVPKEIREKLGGGAGDVLQWDIVDNRVLVSAARPLFLDRQGRIKVGQGDVVRDVRKARKRMGVKEQVVTSANPAPSSRGEALVRRLRGRSTVKMATDEILSLTRR
jgi:bifunctional DNA-binding transcriptional regulator/antitoxin component of YhaV-PrlF toxin-antitoxin module